LTVHNQFFHLKFCSTIQDRLKDIDAQVSASEGFLSVLHTTGSSDQQYFWWRSIAPFQFCQTVCGDQTAEQYSTKGRT
jgi:hypothetical protein